MTIESGHESLLAKYSVVIALPVLWGDQDAFGHVNNNAYFRWFESARVDYFQRIGLIELFKAERIGPILASISCDYRRQLNFPDTVHVGVRATRIGRTSLGLEHAIVSQSQQVVAAEGSSTIVVFDYKANRPHPVPPAIRQAIEILEAQTKIVSIGEILWDLLPSGKQMGGAPTNFACHARALGVHTSLITRVGDDAPGHEILERLPRHGLSTDTVTIDADAPTGTVSVELGADGQPTFTIHENVAWDRIELNASARAAAAEAGAICFGSLAQRCLPSRLAIREAVLATGPEAFRIFDVNIRPPYVDREVIEGSLQLANVVKLNDQELPLLAAMFDVEGGSRQQLEGLACRFGLRLVALTRGAEGSLLYSDGVWSDHAGFPTEVCDTVGAGDAFTAVLAVGLLRGWPTGEINDRANRVAAFVCSQPGATPALPAGLLSR